MTEKTYTVEHGADLLPDNWLDEDAVHPDQGCSVKITLACGTVIFVSASEWATVLVLPPVK